MEITIRHAALDDAPLLADIGAETFFDSFAADNTPEIQAAEIAEPFSLFLIAEADGIPAGYARIKESAPEPFVTGARPIELVRIYSLKRWIGRGVGAALMQACLDEAARMGCDVIWLGVWEINRRAIRFYQKWGFVQVGKHIFLMGDDPQTDWVMERTLASKARPTERSPGEKSIDPG
jgi:diamine N-acetyltransferase